MGNIVVNPSAPSTVVNIPHMQLSAAKAREMYKKSCQDAKKDDAVPAILTEMRANTRERDTISAFSATVAAAATSSVDIAEECNFCHRSRDLIQKFARQVSNEPMNYTVSNVTEHTIEKYTSFDEESDLHTDGLGILFMKKRYCVNVSWKQNDISGKNDDK